MRKESQREINGWIEITTPYLDRHNDYIQIYLRQNGDEWELTDDGETLTDLVQSGFDMETPHIKEILHNTIHSFGMNIQDGAITVKINKQSLFLAKERLIEAIRTLNELSSIT